jgi:hypothetical protein
MMAVNVVIRAKKAPPVRAHLGARRSRSLAHITLVACPHEIGVIIFEIRPIDLWFIVIDGKPNCCRLCLGHGAIRARMQKIASKRLLIGVVRQIWLDLRSIDPRKLLIALNYGRVRAQRCERFECESNCCWNFSISLSRPSIAVARSSKRSSDCPCFASSIRSSDQRTYASRFLSLVPNAPLSSKSSSDWRSCKNFSCSSFVTLAALRRPAMRAPSANAERDSKLGVFSVMVSAQPRSLASSSVTGAT